MLFNSFTYLFLIFTSLIVYYTLGKKSNQQNLILILASGIFYACWDYRFFSLILLSATIDFILSKKIQSRPNTGKIYLTISIILNLSLLVVFKYFNFFIDSLQALIPISKGWSSLEIILPVGISFYTFQTMSYTIDVFRKKINAQKSFSTYLTYVSFFPQLVAGPIERAGKLIPQLERCRKLNADNLYSGFRRILYGLCLKIFIADQCGIYVNEIFDFHEQYNGSSILLGSFLFSLQIYCDFSGYSHIAIGSAQLFGIKLSENFKTPYLSTSFKSFWKRWHISLSEWFRDYVYIPLGGKNKLYLSILVTFGLSGLWHGANGTFLFWGLLHAIFYLVENKIQIRFPSYINRVIVFALTCFAFLFFRADNIEQGFLMSKKIVISSFQHPFIAPIFLLITCGIFAFLDSKWTKKSEYFNFQFSPIIRFPIYAILIVILILLNQGEKFQFLYFQF